MSILRIAMLTLGLLLSGAAIAELKVVSEGKAIQVRTDELVVHSKRVGRDFLVEVTLPDQQPGRRYPAVYALDGGLGVAGPASRLLIAGQRTEPFYVVAIGYRNALGRHSGPRNTDLAHRRVKIDGRWVGGGGAAFEAFILEELRPYLERRYPLDPTRAVLMGHSGGGLFSATVLVTKPAAFSAYVIGGVPLMYESPLPEQAKAIAPHGNGQRVFVGFAPVDARNSGSDRFAPALSGPESKFNVREEVFEGETHNSEYLLLVARGLQFVLPTETAGMVATKLKPQVVDRYVGTYRIDARQTVSFSKQGDALFGQLNDGGSFALAAASETRFFSTEANAIVTFTPAAAGKSRSVVLKRDQLELSAERIE